MLVIVSCECSIVVLCFSGVESFLLCDNDEEETKMRRFGDGCGPHVADRRILGLATLRQRSLG